MVAAIAAYFAAIVGEDHPTVVVVEPDQADCFYRTAETDDGELYAVTGEMRSILGGDRSCKNVDNPAAVNEMIIGFIKSLK